MIGPEKIGYWSKKIKSRNNSGLNFLKVSLIYEVVREFKDYDGFNHSKGEKWRYLGGNFLPYEDGVSLFVSKDDRYEWHIRMQWREETQGAILDNFPCYLKEVKSLSI